jgi:hypothetical protein
MGNATADTKNISEALQGPTPVSAQRLKFPTNCPARFEYGTTVNVRLLYGEWNFGAGKLLVGQDYLPHLH